MKNRNDYSKLFKTGFVIGLVIVVAILFSRYEIKSPYRTPTPETVGQLCCADIMDPKGEVLDFYLRHPKERSGINAVSFHLLGGKGFLKEVDAKYASNKNNSCDVTNVFYQTKDTAIVQLRTLKPDGKVRFFALDTIKVRDEWFIVEGGIIRRWKY